MAKPISVRRALFVGLIVVNGPVWLVLFGGLGASVVYEERLGLTGWLGPVSVIGPIVSACIGGSIVLPRWRVWALERVDDKDALIRRAVESRLMWPPGHVLARTEVRTRAIREREKAVGWEPKTDSLSSTESSSPRF